MSKRDLSGWVEVERPQSKKDLRGWEEVKAPSQEGFTPKGSIGQDLFDLLKAPYRAGQKFGTMLKQAPEQLEDLRQLFKESPAEGFKRTGQNIGTGLFGAAKGFSNIDKNINEYLKSRELPSLSEESLPGNKLRSLFENEYAQGLEEFLKPGGSRPSDVLVQGISEFLPYGKFLSPTKALALNAIAHNENPVEAALIPTGIKGVAQGVTKIPGALSKGAKGISNVSKAAKNVAQEAVETFKASPKLESMIEQAKTNKLAAEEALLQANERAAAKHKEFTGTSTEQAKGELAASLKKVTGDISENLSKRYEEFNESAAGKRGISEPINRQKITEEYKISPKDISKETLNILTKEPTVSSYIDAWRQVRDEAIHARKLSHGEIPYGKKQAYVENAKALEKLADDLNSKARQSLTPEEAANFDALQKDYKNLKIPLRKSTIKKATAEHPEVSTKNFNASISKLGIPELKDVLLKDANFREKLAKHDLMDLDVSNTKKLQQVIEGDIGKALPEKQFKELSEHLEYAQKQQKAIEQAKIDLAKHGLKKAEIDRKISKFKKLAAGGAVVIAGKQLLNYLLGL